MSINTTTSIPLPESLHRFQRVVDLILNHFNQYPGLADYPESDNQPSQEIKHILAHYEKHAPSVIEVDFKYKLASLQCWHCRCYLKGVFTQHGAIPIWNPIEQSYQDFKNQYAAPAHGAHQTHDAHLFYFENPEMWPPKDILLFWVRSLMTDAVAA